MIYHSKQYYFYQATLFWVAFFCIIITEGCSQTARINKNIPLAQFNADSLPLYVINSAYLKLDSDYKMILDGEIRTLNKILADPNVVIGNINFAIKNDKLIISSADGAFMQSYKVKVKKQCLIFKKVDRNIIIPLLFANRHINKFRLYHTKEGKTLLWCRYINEGMLLFFGSGNTYDQTFELIIPTIHIK